MAQVDQINKYLDKTVQLQEGIGFWVGKLVEVGPMFCDDVPIRVLGTWDDQPTDRPQSRLAFWDESNAMVLIGSV